MGLVGLDKFYRMFEEAKDEYSMHALYYFSISSRWNGWNDKMYVLYWTLAWGMFLG